MEIKAKEWHKMAKENAFLNYVYSNLEYGVQLVAFVLLLTAV
jgi:hypothetical protein